MKTCFLDFYNGRWFLCDIKTKRDIIELDSVGDIDGDIDWDLVESIANELGYNLIGG